MKATDTNSLTRVDTKTHKSMKAGLRKIFRETFNRLPLAERTEMLIGKSQLLISQEQTNMISTLYDYKNMFVEVLVDKNSYEMIAIRAIDEDRAMQKYLNRFVVGVN